MQFTDFTFIFLFLPAFFFIFYLIPRRIRAAWILIGSAFFYFWAEPLFFWILLLLVLINYFFAWLIDRSRKTNWLSRILLWGIVAFDLLLLILFRDSATILRVLSLPIGCLQKFEKVLSPTGISFITFALLAYHFDNAKGALINIGNIFKFSSFIFFFPKIQQGPIQTFPEFQSNIKEFNISLGDVSQGIARFILGLSKKVLIADRLAPIAESVFTADLSKVGFGLSWYALIAFGLQIYFDFSGYTDMAIGLANALGFHLPENFNNPYACTSVADFWRRWHITLTAWFRKYIFFPLEFSLKWLGDFRQPLNLVIVFLLTGAWHGLSANFIVWGGYFGLILAMESIGLGRILKRLPGFFQHTYALLMVFIGWIFFRLRSPANWPLFFRALSGMNGFSTDITARTLNILGYLPVLILAVLLCIPININATRIKLAKFNFIYVGVLILLFILTVAFLIEGGYQSFIYRQF